MFGKNKLITSKNYLFIKTKPILCELNKSKFVFLLQCAQEIEH